MVITLIKKEFKQSVNVFIPVIIGIEAILALIFFPIIYANYFKLDFSLITSTLYGAIFIPIVISILVLSIMAIIKVLYTNIYNSNGYELFTLPVSSLEIIISKIATIILWSVIIVITFIASSQLLMTFTNEFNQNIILVEIQNLLMFIKSYPLRSLVYGLSDFTSSINTLLTMLLAGAIVHTRHFQKYRGGIAFAFYVFINNVISRISYAVIDLKVFNNVWPNSLTNNQLLVLLFLNIFILFALVYSINYIWNNKLEIS